MLLCGMREKQAEMMSSLPVFCALLSFAVFVTI